MGVKMMQQTAEKKCLSAEMAILEGNFNFHHIDMPKTVVHLT
jgi:hypothetical protein